MDCNLQSQWWQAPINANEQCAVWLCVRGDTVYTFLYRCVCFIFVCTRLSVHWRVNRKKEGTQQQNLGNALQSSSSSFKSLPVPCTTAPASIWSMQVCWPGGVGKGRKFEVVEKKQERTDSISAHCDKRYMRRLIGPIRVLLWRVVKVVVHWWKRHTWVCQVQQCTMSIIVIVPPPPPSPPPLLLHFSFSANWGRKGDEQEDHSTLLSLDSTLLSVTLFSMFFPCAQCIIQFKLSFHCGAAAAVSNSDWTLQLDAHTAFTVHLPELGAFYFFHFFLRSPAFILNFLCLWAANRPLACLSKRMNDSENECNKEKKKKKIGVLKS